MVKVKICGITNLEDAIHAIYAGADLLGFNFYPKSARYISQDKAVKIICDLPPFVFKVGVFVNENRNVIQDAVQRLRLDYIQLHGDELPEDCEGYGCGVIKVFHAGTPVNLTSYQGKIHAILMDSPHDGRYGGMGKVFDWKQMDKYREMPYPLMLSGGLNPQNVSDAVAQVRPYAVDAASQLESSPGKKDPEKVRQFILNAKGVK